MYSAISFADGSQPDFGKEILDAIADEDYDNIFVAGFAKDFCVKSTLQDIMKEINPPYEGGKGMADYYIDKFYAQGR